MADTTPMNVDDQLLRQALDSMPQAVIVADLAGRISYRNRSAESLGVGEALGDVLGLDWRNMQAGVDGRTATDVAIELEGGRRLVVDVWARQIDGADDAIVVIVTDTSRRTSMAKRAVADEKASALGDMAARVAHELNNPLDGVLRYLGLADRVAGPEAADYLAGARQGLERMARIGRDLVEQGRGGGPLGASLTELIEEAVAAMRPRADAIGVQMDCHLSGEAIGPRNLFQVFCNVIKNAMDAMPTGGRLTVSTRDEGSMCIVSIADTGAGLSPENAEHAFDAFFTTKAPGQGVGLGLAVSREIVGRAGGSIDITTRPGGGAEVTICLPAGRTTLAGATPAGGTT